MSTATHSSFGNEEYTVGWICALPLELTAARGMLDEEHGLPREVPDLADKNTYVLGSIGQFKIVIACLPLIRDGSISMGVIANRMLFTFPKIRVGLLVGIGEGIPDHENHRDIRLGDVVIGSDDETGGVVAHDFGKEISNGQFYAIPALNRLPEALSSALMKMKSTHDMQENKVAEYIDQMLDKYPRLRNNGYCHPGPSSDRLFESDYPHQGNTCRECDPAKLVCRQDRMGELFNVHYGIIASGSLVVKDSIMREQIRAKYQAICLERGAAELAHGFPCIVIRGIWDYADSHNNDRWKPCAAAAAAACAKELLQHLQPRVVDGEPTMKNLLSRG